MGNQFKCKVCNCSIRIPNKQMEYVGFVCSTCYRMSDKKYKEIVKVISLEKIENIMNEIKRLKVIYE